MTTKELAVFIKNFLGEIKLVELKEIFQMLSYPFVIRAFIVGILVSLCAALLGVILVLKRYSLIGHGLADVGFASLAIASVLGISSIYISMPIITVCSFFIMYLSQNKKIHGDVAIGIFSTGALALGVLITSMKKGFNADIYSYMFGSILAINQSDVILSVFLSLVVLVLFSICYNRLFLVTVDESFARASGINVNLYQFLISFLTALTVVLGMRMMGTLLISSLVIFPAVIAKKIANSFKNLILLSAIISSLCFILGIWFSIVWGIPTGASIVVINILLLLLVSAFEYIFKIVKV